ncbi:aldo/keto reductase [Chelatococcus sp. SYSU_G07232]|uniref:Aldo/keto reductase n=1 Tax=Chelatococcus albus TaxID=3047466 RepID=A0ABT7AES7_9HYPH|nr:aldo/keto reductase [Chelatococcus sp. SYSU_G07232]MDJ1157492.1 aldo/keto reductase [Chelatococcus sp. SYSU_G07232]
MSLASPASDSARLPTRPLGRTGLPVTVVGFGAAPLGDLYTKLDDATAVATVEAAVAAGITLVDTSPHYGNGLAEHRCGTALRRFARDSFVLSTKVGRWMDPRGAGGSAVGEGVAAPGFAGGLPHRSVIDYSYDGALRSFEQSLIRLGTDRIDILLIHDVDVWTHGPDAIEARFREAMEGAYRALDRLRAEGAVKAIGIGVNETEMCLRFAGAGDFDVMLLAGRYSLLEQEALGRFLPLAQEKGIGILLGGVFNSGILATGAVPGARYNYAEAPPAILERVRRIEAVCRAHGVALPQAALHFPLGHPAVASVVLGAVTPQEVARNVATLAIPVPAGLWRDLKAEGLIAPDVPTP